MSKPRKPELLNKNHYRGEIAPVDAVYIGRPSRWGNPFTIGKDGNREQVIEKYEDYLIANPEMMKAIRDNLRGRDLMCYCAPKACHGDLILRIANT